MTAWIKEEKIGFNTDSWSCILLMSDWKDPPVKDKATQWPMYFGTYFSCDYLSLKGLFYNSVNDQTLLILTKKGFSMETKDYELTLKPHPVQLCFLSVLSTVSASTLRCYSDRWGIHTEALEWIPLGNGFIRCKHFMGFFEPQSSATTRQTAPIKCYFIFFQSIRHQSLFISPHLHTFVYGN